MSPAALFALAVGAVSIFAAGVGVGVVFTISKARKALRNTETAYRLEGR